MRMEQVERPPRQPACRHRERLQRPAQPSTVTEDSPAVSPSGDLETVPPTAWDMAIGKSDVSNSKDMYSILKDLKIIAKETGCAVMFIHHTRKRVFERGESIQELVLGSTALHAWSDFIMNLAAPAEDSDLLRIRWATLNTT